jgi:hypothetical protein
VVDCGKAAAVTTAGQDERTGARPPQRTWPTSGNSAPVSKALAALGSAHHATVVRSDGQVVSLVTRDALLH